MHKNINGIRRECPPEEEKYLLDSWKRGEEKLKLKSQMSQDKKERKTNFLGKISQLTGLDIEEIKEYIT